MTRSGSFPPRQRDSCPGCADRRRAARDSRRRHCSRLETGQRRARGCPPGRVEFPVGNTIHGRHQFRLVRIAPDGQRLALSNGPDIVVLDRSGQKTTLSTGWGDMITLAWSPSGDEVWFTAPPSQRRCGRCAPSRSRQGARALPSSGDSAWHPRRLPRWPCPDRDARGQDGVLVCPARRVQPRELSWLDGSAPEALSRDGGSVLFSEMFRGAGERFDLSAQNRRLGRRPTGRWIWRRSSPDGKWVWQRRSGRQHWILMPTGPGSAKTLPPGPLVARCEANFLPNGRQIVFGGREKDRGGESMSRTSTADRFAPSLRRVS